MDSRAAQERQERRAAAQGSDGGILSINPESPAAIIGVVVASVLLDLAVWFRSAAIPVLLVVAAFGLVTGAFDAREVLVQVSRADRLLVILAALITVMHLGAAVLALWMMRRPAAVPARL